MIIIINCNRYNLVPVGLVSTHYVSKYASCLAWHFLTALYRLNIFVVNYLDLGLDNLTLMNRALALKVKVTRFVKIDLALVLTNHPLRYSLSLSVLPMLPHS